MQKQQLSEEAQELVDGFITFLHAGGKREPTIRTRRYQVMRFCVNFDPLKVTENALLSWFGQQQWSAETRKSQRAAAQAFFGWLLMSGKREDNPAVVLPKVHSPKTIARPCPDRFIISAMREADSEEQIMIRLAAECGLRRGEICRVSSNDVVDDLLGKTLIVHGKGGKVGFVPLPDDLANIIMGYDGYLFPGRWGGHCEESYVGKRLSQLLPEGWSGHTLRHRFATTAYEETHDILLVSRALRHESVATTQRYVAMPESRMRAVASAVKLVS